MTSKIKINNKTIQDIFDMGGIFCISYLSYIYSISILYLLYLLRIRCILDHFLSLPLSVTHLLSETRNCQTSVPYLIRINVQISIIFHGQQVLGIVYQKMHSNVEI